jgi:hypothetical protein
MNKKLVLSAMLVMALSLGFVFIGCDIGIGGTGGTTGGTTGGATRDTTAPVLSLQAMAQYGDTADGTTATVVFTSNEAGSYYVQALGSAAAAPNASALAGRGLTGTVTAGVTTAVSITGLTKNSSYKAYVTVKDAAGNYSAVWSSAAFTPTQKTDDTIKNMYIGTWIMDNPPNGTTGAKGIATDTTFESYAMGSFTGGSWVLVCSGTYTYAGHPAIWVVGTTSQYTTLKVGDIGIAEIDTNGKMVVFNFAEPTANGTYTKQP